MSTTKLWNFLSDGDKLVDDQLIIFIYFDLGTTLITTLSLYNSWSNKIELL